MRVRPVRLVDVPGLAEPIGGEALAIIAGPCTLESLDLGLEVGEQVAEVCDALGLPYIFKASFDKANRTSGRSVRGPGLEVGLAWLAEVKERLGVPVLTDVHEAWQTAEAAEVVDVLQIPAFLCRQTDLLRAAGETGKVVNIKKGQFMAPDNMVHALSKVTDTGNERVFTTERGVSFGYHDLIADMRSLAILRRVGYPVVFDATHSVQQPGAAGGVSGGQREFVGVLARAAVAAGCDGLFLETHPDPERAMSDGSSMVALSDVEALLHQVAAIRDALVDAPDVSWERGNEDDDG